MLLLAAASLSACTADEVGPSHSPATEQDETTSTPGAGIPSSDVTSKNKRRKSTCALPSFRPMYLPWQGAEESPIPPNREGP